MKTLHGLTLSALLLGGCAGYHLDPITPGEAAIVHEPKNSKEGYIFYEPHPFILGTLKSSKVEGKVESKGEGKGESKGEGKVETKVTTAEYDYQLVYLPDYDRPYRFTRYEVFAKNDLKITFANGWMFTGAESSTDTTAAMTAITDLLKGVMKMDVGGAATPDPIVLFRLEVVTPGAKQTGTTYKLKRVDLDLK